MTRNSADALRLDQQICFPLYAASNLTTKLYRPLLREIGLTYPQYLVMMALWERSPHSVGSLGDLLHLDSGTLTPLLKRMEGAGLILRQRDPADERRVLVSLTEAGAALKFRAQAIPDRLASGLCLTPAMADELRGALQRLVASLAAAGAPEADGGPATGRED